MLKGKALRNRVKALLNSGQNRAEVFESLKAEANEQCLANCIVGQPDPILVAQHIGKIKTFSSLVLLHAALVVISYLISHVRNPSYPAFTWLYAAYLVALAVLIYKPNLAAYKIYAFTLIINASSSFKYFFSDTLPLGTLLALHLSMGMAYFALYLGQLLFPHTQMLDIVSITASRRFEKDGTRVYTFLAPPKG